MASRKYKLPLSLVLVVPFVLQIVGAVGLTGYLSQRNGQKAVHNLGHQLSTQASQRIIDHLDENLGQPHEVLAVDVLLSKISDFLRTIQISPSARTFIMETNGYLIANSGDTLPTKNVSGKAVRLLSTDSEDHYIRASAAQLLQHFQTFKQITNPAILDVTVNGERLYVLVRPWQDEKHLDWLVVVTVPEKDFMKEINANTRATVILCLMALAGAIVLGAISSYCIIKPIKQTLEAIDSLAAGDWKQSLNDSVFAELSLLTRAFNHMAEQLKHSFYSLEYHANHDGLTGLYNQQTFKLKLEKTILFNLNKNQIYQNNFAVLFLDLDDFKLVNDSMGHLMGDFLLQQVANRLLSCVRNSDVVARFGGDEFVILLKQIDNKEQAIKITNRICEQLKKPFDLCGNQVFIGASVGVVFNDKEMRLTDDFLRNADIALYRAKANGRGSYEIFDRDMHSQVLRRLTLETDLRKALEKNELQVYYQPIFEAKSNQLTGFEALMRWQHSLHGWISPGEFIPIAEETGLIVELGWWLAKEACYQLCRWQVQFPDFATITMSVNLSPKQFFQPDLISRLENMLKETAIKNTDLKLEITENVFIKNSQVTVKKLKTIRDLGIQLSLDDFGTGYSSLSYINHFALDNIKIDRSFIQDIQVQGKNYAIVEAIIVLANKLNMNVTAEGVETIEQLSYLQAIGCHQIQGYLFSPPVAPEQAQRFITHINIK